MSLLSTIQYGPKESNHVVVMLSGFPDDETSGWGDFLVRITSVFTNYRFLCMCLPDYEDNAVPKTWGYSFDEILVMLEATINFHIASTTAKFILCIHDWGSFVGMKFENIFPNRVSKIISFDIGIGMDISAGSTAAILCYQWWFATSYVISQIISESLGEFIFKLYFNFIPKFILPTPNDTLKRPIDRVRVHMAYPYYYFWKYLLLGNKILPNYPRCPILFFVSFLAAFCAISLD